MAESRATTHAIEMREQVEKRGNTAFIVLATMTLSSAMVSTLGLLGAAVPDQILSSSAIITICAGVGVIGTILFQMYTGCHLINEVE